MNPGIMKDMKARIKNVMKLDMPVPTYLSILTILFCLSCTSRKDKMDLIEIHPSPGYFQEHFELHSIVPVETSDSFLLADIDKIVKAGEDYLLLSKKVCTVLLIDGFLGKVKTKISKYGTGPGESRNILDMAFDEERNHILVYNDYSKLLRFDLNGRFLFEHPIDGIYEGLTFYDGKAVFYNKLNGYSCFPYQLGLLDLSTNGWSRIGTDEELYFPMRSKGLQLVRSRGVYFNAPLDFNIYRLEGNDYSSVKELNFPKERLTDEFIRLSVKNPIDFMTQIREDAIVYSINSIRELDFCWAFRTNLMELCFLPKDNEARVLKDKFVFWDFFNLTPADYCPHDGDDDKLIFVLDANRWVDGLKTLGELPSDWKKMVSSVNVRNDDNQILLVFKESKIID